MPVRCSCRLQLVMHVLAIAAVGASDRRQPTSVVVVTKGSDTRATTLFVDIDNDIDCTRERSFIYLIRP